MAPGPELRTPRLLMRRWRQDDLAPFAAINTDPEVMRYLPALLSRAESDDWAERIERHFDEHGFGLWAVEVPGVESFIGYTGLTTVSFEAPFTPAVEVGWRLARRFWGKGYATEAARAALDFAFDTAGLREVVSFTVSDNRRSRAVMERIGMTHDPADDFVHPRLGSEHRLGRALLYRARPAGEPPARDL